MKILAAAVLVASTLVAGPAQAADHKVTICHATSSASNPYVQITVAKQSIIKGHAHDAHQDAGDIIPPFEGYDGRNWTTEGQAIHSLGCVLPTPPPHTVEPEPTPVPEPTIDPEPIVEPDPVEPDPEPSPVETVPAPINEPEPVPTAPLPEVPTTVSEVEDAVVSPSVAGGNHRHSGGVEAPKTNTGLNVQTAVGK